MDRALAGLAVGLLVVGLLAVGLLVVGLASAAPDFAALSIQPYEPPKAAPAFSLPDLDGKTRQLADLHGKVVMVFFWTTW